MKSYSQNKEDLFVLDYFKGYKGTLFEIGANDGITLSNSKLLIENEWKAYLFEPSSAFNALYELHSNKENVILNQFGINDKNGFLEFWESENHIPNANDYGLVSTTIFEETKRWPNVKFHKKIIELISFNDYWSFIGKPIIDFISLDVEGMEWEILKSIDLTAIGCNVLCIEFNSNSALKVQFTNYCSLYGLKLAHITPENLLFVR